MRVDLSKCETGYFADPDRPNEPTLVHIVSQNTNRPICGCRLRQSMAYQWCSHNIFKSYIECSNCLRILKRKRS